MSQSVMEQFNPGLRNLVNLGKNYEKSVTGECSGLYPATLDVMLVVVSGRSLSES